MNHISDLESCAKGSIISWRGSAMRDLVRIPLEGGGAVAVEAAPELQLEGPVKAGRITDAVSELPQTLREFLDPVRSMAQTVLEQLRQAGPAEAEVEFGVNLSAKAGAVITSGEGAVHLKVRVLWKHGEPAEGAQ
ncbi:CU044_2847 family protein [Streptomyces rubiginosohelvolus]